jgi:hypothetical protein
VQGLIDQAGIKGVFEYALGIEAGSPSGVKIVLLF